jgi:hypothetical protein
MDEHDRKHDRRNGRYGRKWPETRVEFPPLPYPEDAKITVKHIAYLHAYCRKEPRDIVARYPRVLSLAQVHLALAHYYSNQEAIDAEIAAERRFNAQNTLAASSMTLPPVGFTSLVETLNAGERQPERREDDSRVIARTPPEKD